MIVEKTLLDENTLTVVEHSLKRIFSLAVTRSTYREVQNMVVTATNADKEKVDAVLRCLLSGKVNTEVVSPEGEMILDRIIEKFTVPARLSREVLERGEYVSLLTSDTLTSDKLLNVVRRVDGKEFQFVTDPKMTCNLLQHFVARMNGMKELKGGQEALDTVKEELRMVKKTLEELCS
jgi:hypothetical protein